MVEASLTLLDTQQVDDCWNRIGVHGDKSCERLAEHVHCRNCEVYAAAATYLLDRIALRQDQLDSAETMDSQREQSDLGETRSILVFRLGEEWFGLATGSLVEVAPMNPIHSLPHQRSRALQVTNGAARWSPAFPSANCWISNPAPRRSASAGWFRAC